MSATAVPIRPLKKGSVLKLWLALILLSVVAVAAAWQGTRSLQFRTTESGLQYRVLKEGEGEHPTSADVTLIDYTGRLPDGTEFETTRGRQPVPMPVSGAVPGFSEGLQLMRKGATFRFRIPPELGYGSEERRDQATGKVVIPADSTLEFDVTLHEFMNMAQLQGMMGGMPGGAPPPPMPPQ